jgi:uncharacterized pyridoxamine 5'-phosphate oxidase family protein
MSWKIFEASAPELASIAHERLNRKIVYLATVKSDGSPRLHPVTPFIGEGMLFMFTESTSPKIKDLSKDGRYAMHCAVGGSPLVEVLVSGRAEVITDLSVRAKATGIAGSPVVTESYYLFEFHVARALVVEYDADKNKMPRHWRSAK